MPRTACLSTGVRTMLRRTALVAIVGLLALVPAVPQNASGARTTGASLNRTLPEMNFDGVALTDCVDFLRDITSANIVVNWKALEGAGVTPETLVNLKLRGVSLRKALSLMLAEAGGGEGITYTLDEGVIEITTTELANKKVYTRVYPIGDLMMEIPNFVAPSFSLESNNSGSGGSGGGSSGGGGGGIFSESGGEGDRGEAEGNKKTREEREEELVSLVRETIYPDVWRENGGTASIRIFRDNMVVTAPRNVHESIGGTWD